MEIYFLSGDWPGKGVRGVIRHYWKWDGKLDWILDGGANIASVFVFGTEVFQNSLNRGDELVGLFAIVTVKDVALQCCRVSFELIHWWACLAVLEVTSPWTIRVVAFVASTFASACASATASAVCRFNRTWFCVSHHSWWIRVFDL